MALAQAILTAIFPVAIPIAVFLVAGAVVSLRSDLTRYHIPTIMLALFTLTSGVLVPVYAYSINRDANTIDYQVEPQAEGCETVDTGRVHEFSDLSPDAQDVFLSALRSDGTYATTVAPSEYRIGYDTPPDYIIYESDCYSLDSQVPHSGGTGLVIYALLLLGIPIIAVLAVLTVYSYRVGSFRIPAAAVSGISVATGGYVVLRGLLIPASLLIAAAVWIRLKGFEPLR